MRQLTQLIALTFFMALTTSLTAQVGVNEANPEQALDVNGKVKVGDDSNTPTAGTIRYNDPEASFEGYNGTEWQSFTEKAGAPDGMVAVQFYHFGSGPENAWYIPDQGIQQATGFTAAQIVPAGKIFVVDRVSVTPTTDNAGSYYVGIRQATSTGGGFNPQVFFRIPENGGAFDIAANRSPLLVVRAGNQLQLYNGAESPGRVRFQVYGFWVDDLSDYYGL